MAGCWEVSVRYHCIQWRYCVSENQSQLFRGLIAPFHIVVFFFFFFFQLFLIRSKCLPQHAVRERKNAVPSVYFQSAVPFCGAALSMSSWKSQKDTGFFLAKKCIFDRWGLCPHILRFIRWKVHLWQRIVSTLSVAGECCTFITLCIVRWLLAVLSTLCYYKIISCQSQSMFSLSVHKCFSTPEHTASSLTALRWIFSSS